MLQEPCWLAALLIQGRGAHGSCSLAMVQTVPVGDGSQGYNTGLFHAL